MPVRPAGVTTRRSMIGLKRFIRPGVVVSAIGHVGLVVLGLQLVGANPRESVPPDAMVVEIVPPDEAPRFSGTPSNLRTSGSESSSPSNAGNAAAQSPPPKPAARPPQQPQKRPDPQREARQAAAQAQTPPPPASHAEMAQPQTAKAETANAETARPETQQTQTSDPPPAPPQPRPEETRDEPGTAEVLARLALAGGRLGGGFPAPPVNTTFAAYDFTTPFRERVSSCSSLPAGIDPGEKIMIKLRVFLNPDGSLASPPRALDPLTSWKQQALMQSAATALEKCQPYTMLPAEKYKQWKTLDLIIFPTNFLGG